MDTVPELDQRKAENRLAALTETNSAKKLVRQVSTLNALKDWIAAAKNMPSFFSIGCTHHFPITERIVGQGG